VCGHEHYVKKGPSKETKKKERKKEQEKKARLVKLVMG